MPYGGSAAGDLEFAGAGMATTGDEGSMERRRSDGGVSEASDVMRSGGVKERRDPRTRASGAEYTKHG